MVQHYGSMEDDPVPVIPWHLFLGEVGAGHLDESPPGAFDETVCALSCGGSGNDLGLVVVDPSGALAPHKFAVEVSVELAGEVGTISLESGEGVDDFVGRGGIEAIEPEVLGHHIKWEEVVAVASHRGAISVDNVHLEFV